MTITTPTIGHLITERDIHAYVDGELSPARRAQVEAYLALQPDDAARVEAYRAQNIGMHALFDHYTVESLPLSFGDNANAQAPGATHGWPSRALRKVPVMLLAGALLATFAWRQPMEDPPIKVTASDAFLQDANDAYRRFAADGVVTASGGIQASEARQWLAERYADPRLPIPDLSAIGFNTTGGRVVDSSGVPAAHLVYRDEMGRVVTLHITKRAADTVAKDSARTAFTFIRRDDASMFYWETGAFAYALIGEFTRKHLVKIASIVMDQIEARHERDSLMPGTGNKGRPPQATAPISTVKAVESGTEPVSPRKPGSPDSGRSKAAATKLKPLQSIPSDSTAAQNPAPKAQPAGPSSESEVAPRPAPQCDDKLKADPAKPCSPSGA